MLSSVDDNKFLKELHAELSKTAVISDSFKDFIFNLVLQSVEESGKSVTIDDNEQELLNNEFKDRLFNGKASVKLGSRTFFDLLKSLTDKEYSGRVVGEFLDRYYPNPNDAIIKLLTGSFEEVVSVREWLWMGLNENPSNICKIEKSIAIK